MLFYIYVSKMMQPNVTELIPLRKRNRKIYIDRFYTLYLYIFERNKEKFTWEMQTKQALLLHKKKTFLCVCDWRRTTFRVVQYFSTCMRGLLFMKNAKELLLLYFTVLLLQAINGLGTVNESINLFVCGCVVIQSDSVVSGICQLLSISTLKTEKKYQFTQSFFNLFVHFLLFFFKIRNSTRFPIIVPPFKLN